MEEQEYQDKLKVRSQLSVADKVRMVEHELEILQEKMKGQVDTVATLIVEVTHLGGFKPE